jgi:DNA-binding IclR family transcriptional regulator
MGYMKRQEASAGRGCAPSSAIGDVAARGFTLSIGEWERDINAVGVPRSRRQLRCLRVQLRRAGLPVHARAVESDIGPRLVNMVRNVEADLNGR